MSIPEGFEPLEFGSRFLQLTGRFFGRKAGLSTVIGMRIIESHTNAADAAHGGVLATLADVCLAYEILQRRPSALQIATVSLTIQMMRAARLGDWLEALGEMDAATGRLAFAHGSIRCDGHVIATMSGVFRVSDAPAK